MVSQTSTILDNSEYEVVIPYIDTDADKEFVKYGYNFNICVRTKSLLNLRLSDKYNLPKGIFLLDKSDADIRKSDYYKNLKQFKSSVVICGLVTSPCDGTIIYIEKSKYKDRYSITIYIDDSQAIVLDNLCFIFYGLAEGSKIFAGDRLGLYYVPNGNSKDVYPYLVFSYATNIPSNFPVRVWDMTYYKQNPTDKLNQIIEANAVEINNDVPGDLGMEFPVPNTMVDNVVLDDTVEKRTGIWSGEPDI